MGNLSFLNEPRSPLHRYRASMARGGERAVQANLAREFDRLGIPYQEQFRTGSGRIDFVVWNEEDERPYIGIEVKPHLGPMTAAREWADYLEQAHGYARSLDVPVLVGPYIDTMLSSGLHAGGPWLSSVAAMTIYGGRVNVGVLALLGPSLRMTWALRGKIVLREQLGELVVDDQHIRMVRSTNSYKARG